MSPKAASAKSANSGKSSKSAKTPKTAKSAKAGSAKIAMKKPSVLPERVDNLDTRTQVSKALSRSQSLNEKLQLLRNSDLNETEKMDLLQKSLAHNDWKAIHGRVQTAAKNDTELNQDLEQSGDRENRRKTIAAWLLDPKRGAVYRRNSACVQATQTFSKNDTWASELKMLKRWTPFELEAHLNSGRIIARECPHTPGVWEYKDLHDVSSTRTVAKNRETMATMESEFAPEDDEELGQFKSFFDSIQGTDNPAVDEGWRMGPKGKGKGGGKAVLGKGKISSSSSRSKNSSKGQPSDEEQMKNAQKRIKTLQTWCRAAQTKIKSTLFDKKKIPKKLQTCLNKLLERVIWTEQDLCDGEDSPEMEKKADTITNACSVLADFRTCMKEVPVDGA